MKKMLSILLVVLASCTKPAMSHSVRVITFAVDENGNRILVYGAPSSQVITFEELVSSKEAILQKETNDRFNLINFLTPSQGNLRAALLRWAAVAFPDCYELFSMPIQPPDQCSDGVVRETFQYIEYLLGKPISDYISVLMTKVSGFQFSYSIPGQEFKLHVHKG